MKILKVKLKDIMRNDKGSLHITTVFLCLIIFSLALIVSEVLIVHDMQQHIMDEMYRATNLAIKTAMYDSYRIDSTSKFDEQVAIEAFYGYLKDDLNLDESFRKRDEEGNIAYIININTVEVNGDTTRMNVSALVYADPLFNLWDKQWEIPIDIVSRNMRID